MVAKKVIAGVLLVLILFSVPGIVWATTYEEFFGEYIIKRANQLEEDANEFENLLDSWAEGQISQSAVVAKLQEMETRADGYFEDILKIPAPEGMFANYKQTVYIFATWSNIIGVFTDGMTDLDLAKLNAASILSDFFEKRIDEFEEQIIQID